MSTGASSLHSLSRLALPLVSGVILSMAMALVGQAAGAVERDHVARVTRGATTRAHRPDADCHGTGEAADITAPPDVAGDDGRVPPTPHARSSTRTSAPAGPPGVAAVAPAAPDTCGRLARPSPDVLTSRAFVVNSPGRAPPTA